MNNFLGQGTYTNQGIWQGITSFGSGIGDKLKSIGSGITSGLSSATSGMGQSQQLASGFDSFYTMVVAIAVIVLIGVDLRLRVLNGLTSITSFLGRNSDVEI